MSGQVKEEAEQEAGEDGDEEKEDEEENASVGKIVVMMSTDAFKISEEAVSIFVRSLVFSIQSDGVDLCGRFWVARLSSLAFACFCCSRCFDGRL